MKNILYILNSPNKKIYHLDIHGFIPMFELSEK